MRIGVLSDTHIPGRARALPGKIFELFAGVDLILHAGDITIHDVLDELAALAPVHAVCGNMDPYELRYSIPRRQVVTAAGKRIGLIHGDGAAGSTKVRALSAFSDEEVDAVVFGHSHMPTCERHGSILLFNPGSPTDRRFGLHLTAGIIHITSDGGLEGEICAVDDK